MERQLHKTNEKYQALWRFYIQIIHPLSHKTYKKTETLLPKNQIVYVCYTNNLTLLNKSESIL